MRIRHAVSAAIGLSFLLALSGGAFAARSYDAPSKGPAVGVTSGPADHTNVYTGVKAPKKMAQIKKTHERTK